jgi:hypothetical protein
VREDTEEVGWKIGGDKSSIRLGSNARLEFDIDVDSIFGSRT